MYKGASILISEPSDVLASELSAFVREKNFHAISARTMKETLLFLQKQRAHLLILDSSLVEEDCGLISIIKGIDEELPIIICADRNTPEFESDARHQGIFYYHIKSFGIQDLEMAVSNALQKRST